MPSQLHLELSCPPSSEKYFTHDNGVHRGTPYSAFSNHAAATPDGSHPLIIPWLVKRKAYLPNEASVRIRASDVAGPQIIKVAENLSSTGCPLESYSTDFTAQAALRVNPYGA